MFTISNYNYYCLRNCRSRDHGETVARNVLHRKNATDEQLAAFIGKSCRNFPGIDFEGFTILHLLCTRERPAVIEWIINYGAQVNAVNPSTGQTPLHSAMSVGAIENAVLLLRHGASVDLSDSFQLRPLNYCRTLNNKKIKFSAYETFVWGSNKNYNLGIATEEDKNHPQQLDYFKKENIFLLSASISTYHSLFLDNQGKVYAVGNGKHGQLGIGDTKTLVLPKLVKLPIKKTECVIRISTARHHSLALTNSNCVYACGSNEQNQLGTCVGGKAKKTPVLSENTFKEVQLGTTPDSGKILGIIARDCHSVAYRQYSVHAWGKNGGQFGVANIDTSVPTKLETFGNQLLLVESSNAAIVCCTAQNNLLIFHKYKMKSVRSPRHETIKAMAILGGTFCVGDTKSDETLKILVCTESNQLYIWYEDINQYIRCTTQLKNLNLSKLLWPREDNIIFVANGNLNSGTIFHYVKKSTRTATEDYQEILSTKKDISIVKEFTISFKRIPKVDRVVEIQCDQLAESFVVLQEHSQRFLDIPKFVDDPLTFKNLMVEASESDSIHDIVFHIDDDIYVAHKFIVFSRARGLREIVEQYPDKHIYLNYEGLSSKMFELMMKHIYSNHALTLTDVEDIETSMGPFSGYTNLEIFDLFREFAGKFGLSKFAGGVYAQSSAKKDTSIKLNRTSFQSLYDVTIMCANNREIHAHKCILVSRMEYFHWMFNNNWSERSTVNLTSVPIEYMEPIIDFLYSNDAQLIRSQSSNYSDNYLYNMIIICDQYFINQLRNIFETLLIDRLSIRKCSDMLEFAHEYNCKLLKKCSSEFIVQNMARVLEHRILEDLDMQLLKEIGELYRKEFKIKDSVDELSLRLGNDGQLGDVLLESFVEDFSVDLNYKCESKNNSKVKETKKFRNNAQDRRSYEKEAKDAIKNLSIETSDTNKKVTQAQINPLSSEAAKIADELHSKINWTKVSEKKSTKKKGSLASPKLNDVLQNEEKEKENFVSLSKKSPTTPIDIPISTPTQNDSDDSNVSLRSNFNLGNFTPTKRMTQKQRKRFPLHSTSIDETTTLEPIKLDDSSVDNVWGNNSSADNAWGNNSPNNSFANIIKSPTQSSSKTSPLCTPQSPGPSASFFQSTPHSSAPFLNKLSKSKSSPCETECFTKILHDERKEREYYEKLKSKSLILTQVEESAISELQSFYNVDNVYDEAIRVERASHIKPTMNFAVWRR